MGALSAVEFVGIFGGSGLLGSSIGIGIFDARGLAKLANKGGVVEVEECCASGG